MEWRKLGDHGPRVSALGLACMGMSWGSGGGETAEMIAPIRRAVALGINGA